MTTPTALLGGEARAAWLAERRTGIGSSDASAIAGMNPWCSALEVYLTKVGEVTDDGAGEAAAWGNRLEAVVADHFAESTGFDVVVPDGMIRSALWPFMTANVDRFLAEPGQEGAETYDALLEIKTTGAHMADGWEQGPPDHVLLQVQHQLAVVDLPRAFVAVLIGGNDYREYEVERDNDLIASLVEIEREFWDLVERRDPPAPDDSKSASQALQRLYADFERDSEVDLPPEARALLEANRNTKRMLRELKDDDRRETNAIKALIGEHNIGLIDGAKAVTWSRWTQKRLDRDAMEADHPALVAQYLVDDPRDRLTFVKEKP